MLTHLANAKGFQQSALAVLSKAIVFMAVCLAFPIKENAALSVSSSATELLYQPLQCKQK